MGLLLTPPPPPSFVFKWTSTLLFPEFYPFCIFIKCPFVDLDISTGQNRGWIEKPQVFNTRQISSYMLKKINGVTLIGNSGPQQGYTECMPYYLAVPVCNTSMHLKRTANSQHLHTEEKMKMWWLPRSIYSWWTLDIMIFLDLLLCQSQRKHWR